MLVSNRTKAIGAAILAALMVLGVVWASRLPAQEGLHFVTNVVDGDTIVLQNGERVRYLGIDTPETVHPD